jgi:hypothetical protein
MMLASVLLPHFHVLQTRHSSLILSYSHTIGAARKGIRIVWVIDLWKSSWTKESENSTGAKKTSRSGRVPMIAQIYAVFFPKRFPPIAYHIDAQSVACVNESIKQYVNKNIFYHDTWFLSVVFLSFCSFSTILLNCVLIGFVLFFVSFFLYKHFLSVLLV